MTATNDGIIHLKGRIRDGKLVALLDHEGKELGAPVTALESVTGRIIKTAGGVTLSDGDVCGLTLNDPTDDTARKNLSLIQSCLDEGGDWTIEGTGTLYWTNPIVQTFVQGVTAQQPSILTIGTNTSLTVGSGITLKPVPLSNYSAFISNKSFMLNKSLVSGWTVGAAQSGGEYRIATLSVSPAMPISVGDWVIVSGDTAYGFDDCFYVEEVNASGAATTIGIRTWKDDINGISKLASDVVYCYKADANIKVDIRGHVSPSGSTPAIPGQLDRAVFMFNKIGFSELSLHDYYGGAIGKMAMFANWYHMRFPTIVKRNVGAGVVLYGPGRDAVGGYLFTEGGEDALLIQNCSYAVTTWNGLQDNDGYQACGDIRAPLVWGVVSIDRGWQRGISLFANADLNKPTLSRRIDGITIDELRCRSSSGASAVHIGSDSVVAGKAGGTVGIVKIGTLRYEDNGSASVVPDAVVKHYTITSPSYGSRWDGLVVDNLICRPSKIGPALGLRAFFASIGYGATATSLLTVGKIIVGDSDVVWDAQNMSAAPRMINHSNYTTLEDCRFNGKYIGAVYLPGMAVSAGGSGYSVGDLLTVSGGTILEEPCAIEVTTVSGGVITGFKSIKKGSYTVPPASPVSVTGGSGTGATFSYSLGSVWNWSFCLPGSTSTALNRFELSGVVLPAANGSAKTGTILRGSTPATTKAYLRNLTYSGYDCFYLTESITAEVSGCDLTGSQYNLSQGKCANSKTVNITVRGNQFSASQSLITPNASQVTSGGAYTLRSDGSNSGLHASASVIKENGGNTGVTLTLDGCCMDLRFNLAPTTDYTVARKDGVIVYNTNAALGTLGAAGLVVGQGTAANSWRLLGDPTLRY